MKSIFFLSSLYIVLTGSLPHPGNNTACRSGFIVNADTVPASANIKAYSKYDFVPGEKVIGFEDFSTGSIGDFPAGWNTNGAAEIVTIEGKPGRWLWLTKPSVFMPEFTDKYPEDFTFEFDLLHGKINGGGMSVALVQLDNISQPQHWTLGANSIKFQLNNANNGGKTGDSKYEIRKNSVSESANAVQTDLLSDAHNPVHISIWRQKERVRLYVNQEKVWDIPKALAREAKLNSIIFYVTYAEATVQHYIGNLRLAIGAPDTRNKLLTQNKWVTHGILFDVNSANIKPESYGTLKEIANVLKENADMKVKIVGHTDSDGVDAANLDLSKRRSASVKAALAKEFGIDENRMETDGKGESQPVDKNDSPAGKANNRRVEFIKI
ncbi:MAG: OmpA family protein [Ferruginibacter sp.]|nr:OmpA family protein [Chitinophagaceae bacterium]MBP6286468.1 OmpA family protein [Ferruginibacter sp.]